MAAGSFDMYIELLCMVKDAVEFDTEVPKEASAAS